MNPRPLLSRLRLLNIRYVRGHVIRTGLLVGVIALSAALIVSVLGTYGSVSGSVQRLAERVAGNADLEVTGVTDSGLEDDSMQVVQSTRGVREVVPLIRSPVVLDGRQTILYGGDERVRALSSSLRNAIDAIPRANSRPDGIYLGPVLAGEFSPGQRAELATLTGKSSSVVVSGQVPGDDAARINGGSFAIAPLPIAQQLTDRLGRLDSILVIAEEGRDVDVLRDDLAAALAGRAYVATPSFRAAQADQTTAVARDVTLLVALLALVVAAFLVFNTTNVAATERRGEMASLRALGARRGVLMRDFLAESLVLSLLGAAIGSAAGVLIGRAAVDQLPPVLTSAVDAKVEFFLPPSAIPIAVIACVGASLAASWLAARAVSRVPPVEAMHPPEASDVVPGQHLRRRSGLLLGTGLVALGGAVAIAVAFDDERALASSSLLVVGVLLLSYVLLRAITAAAAWTATRVGATGRLAAESLTRAPRRVWATTMTVCIAVAVGVAITGTSRNTVEAAGANVSTLSRTDFVVQGATRDELPVRPVLPLALQQRLGSVPGVSRVVSGQFSYVNLDSGRALVQGISGPSNSTAYQLASAEARQRLLAGTGTVISTAFAKQRGLRVADVLTLPTLAGEQRLPVVDIVDYVSVDAGLLAISLDNLTRWFGREGASYFEVMLAPGADRDAVAVALRQTGASFPLPVHVLTGDESVAATESAVRQVGALALALQWIVACVAALALLNTLMLSVVERQRELGILRALGSSSRFLRRMVLAEALGIGVVGAALGLVVGVVLHYLSTVVLTKTIALSVPFHLVPVALAMALGALLIALVGSLPPARRAGRLPVTQVIGYE